MTSVQHLSATDNPVTQFVAQHPRAIKVARVGWFAKGVVYLLSGVLALLVAIKASGWAEVSSDLGEQEASPLGAIKTVAGTTGGLLLLWLLIVGMLLYAAWRVVTATMAGHVSGKAVAHRIGYVASAAMYITFAVNGILLASDSTNMPDGNQDVSDISNWFMAHSAGRVAIGLIGVVVIAVGIYRMSKGVTVRVDDELDSSGLALVQRPWLAGLGAVGETGRGVGFSLVGFFLLRSAVVYDPDEAEGLDGALRRLAEEDWGVAIVILVAIGFAAYGSFCLLTFIHRRLQAP